MSVREARLEKQTKLQLTISTTRRTVNFDNPNPRTLRRKLDELKLVWKEFQEAHIRYIVKEQEDSEKNAANVHYENFLCEVDDLIDTGDEKLENLEILAANPSVSIAGDQLKAQQPAAPLPQRLVLTEKEHDQLIIVKNPLDGNVTTLAHDSIKINQTPTGTDARVSTATTDCIQWSEPPDEVEWLEPPDEGTIKTVKSVHAKEPAPTAIKKQVISKELIHTNTKKQDMSDHAKEPAHTTIEKLFNYDLVKEPSTNTNITKQGMSDHAKEPSHNAIKKQVNSNVPEHTNIKEQDKLEHAKEATLNAINSLASVSKAEIVPEMVSANGSLKRKFWEHNLESLKRLKAENHVPQNPLCGFVFIEIETVRANNSAEAEITQVGYCSSLTKLFEQRFFEVIELKDLTHYLDNFTTSGDLLQCLHLQKREDGQFEYRRPFEVSDGVQAPQCQKEAEVLNELVSFLASTYDSCILVSVQESSVEVLIQRMRDLKLNCNFIEGFCTWNSFIERLPIRKCDFDDWYCENINKPLPNNVNAKTVACMLKEAILSIGKQYKQGSTVYTSAKKYLFESSKKLSALKCRYIVDAETNRPLEFLELLSSVRTNLPSIIQLQTMNTLELSSDDEKLEEDGPSYIKREAAIENENDIELENSSENVVDNIGEPSTLTDTENFAKSSDEQEVKVDTSNVNDQLGNKVTKKRKTSKSEESGGKRTQFYCGLCKKYFKSKNDLKNHERDSTDRHKEVLSRSNSDRRPGDWDCPKCNYMNFAKRKKCYANNCDGAVCYRCDKPGHFARECPVQACYRCNRPGHFARDCPEGGDFSAACFHCGRDGHLAYECPGGDGAEGSGQEGYREEVFSRFGNIENGGGEGGDVKCYYCNRFGHFASDCSFALDCEDHQPACYKCNKKGHVIKDCPNKYTKACFQCGGIGHISRNCPNQF